MGQAYRIHRRDNVAIALTDLQAGQSVRVGEGVNVTLQNPIASGHKFALRALQSEAEIIRYGMPIGRSSQVIAPGEWVHSHNLKTALNNRQEYIWRPALQDVECQLPPSQVQVYRRSSGAVGIRNELWIVPTVNCVNRCGQMMIDQFCNQVRRDDIDGVYLLSHAYGCSQLGDDHRYTRTILQDMVRHPNAGGVLVLGLGCENNQLVTFRESLGDYDAGRVRFMVVQDEGDEVVAGVEHLQALYENMRDDCRQPAPVSVLNIGLECGGSDSFSGITANPLLGRFSDWLTLHGGTTVLTEVPEMFGAEQLLMARAKNRDVFDVIVKMINDFKDYFICHDQPVYENPSPGNKAGGITTLEEKSLGCTQKSGDSPVNDVLGYGERLKTPGLNLLSAPGNDAVATSALMAAGCHMVLFTTGRGTPYGGFVPTLKVSTRSQLAEHKPHWIDFDAGGLLERQTMDEKLKAFTEKIVNVASGQQTRNEINGFRDLAIFKTGVTL